MVAHEVTLQGVVSAAAPTILERTEQEFLAVVLDGLSKDQGLSAVIQSTAKRRDATGTLKLFQPIHRTFHLVLLDASCANFGSPRLDPKKIVAAGLVIRRFATKGKGDSVRQGWMQENKLFRGWVDLSREQELHDPDPAFRRPTLSAGHQEINRLLAMRVGDLTTLHEQQAPLFVVPPEICRSTGRTLLYGVVPLTSSERSEFHDLPSFSKEDLDSHLHTYLKAGAARNLPSGGQTLASLLKRLTPSDETILEEASVVPSGNILASFLVLLKQVAIEFDAFGTDPAGRALYAELDRITLVSGNVTHSAGKFLKAATEVLLERDISRPSAQWIIPNKWPAVSRDRAAKIAQLVLATMQARFAQIGRGQGRFDEEGRRYCLRTFVRVKHDERCPPDIVWSGYSEPFVIAPWYDNNGIPPVQITMPDVTDKEFLKGLKPNVTFSLPPSLFNLLQADAKKLADGDGERPSRFGIQWLCSFSIPLITICAFIVLNIFLQLFNIVFQWLLYIKICIPIPGRKS
ncbi:MAG: hypothetical protein OEY86_02405 [Nitrospira sp.]|nr:hypothetical protein [Nitrospira sp.]